MTDTQKVEIVKEMILDNASIDEIMEVIDARDYSYIEVGARLYWKDPDEYSEGTSGWVIVTDTPVTYPDEYGDDDIIKVRRTTDKEGLAEFEVLAHELYKRVRATCPCCGKQMFRSDVVGYKYVCLECDENFG